MKTARTTQRPEPTGDDLLVERIASEKVTALMKAVDFAPIYGAPRWVVCLILPETELLLAKHPSRWRPEEIHLLQESVNTLRAQVMLAVHMEPTVV